MGHLAAAGAVYTIVYDPFVFRHTTVGVNSLTRIKFPGETATECDIDWGDGTIETVDPSTELASHTYSSAGTYRVEVVGPIISLSLGSGFSNDFDVIEHVSWGTMPLENVYLMFYQCTNLSGSIPQKLPTSVKQAYFLYQLCPNITTIPSNYLDGCSNLLSLSGAFWGTGITSVPDDFGRDLGITDPSGLGVGNLFEDTPLTTIGNNVFRNVGVINSVRFFARNPINNITIGDNFAADNTWSSVSHSAANAFSFGRVVSIGTNFLCGSGGTLSNIGAVLFSCGSLVALPDITDLAPDVDIESAFDGCFNASNTVQEYWTLYPLASVTANCFKNCTNLANYASIPLGWK